MKKVFLTILVLGLLLLNPINIKAKNGSSVTKYNSNSDMLIIGDSRIYGMSQTVGDASYVAVWGGHYGYGGSTMQIDYSSRVKTMEKYIDDIVKKHGSARVYVVATVNDYNGSGSPTGSVNSQVNLINKLKKHNKNATVYGCSLIGEKNGKSVSDYNNLLKSKSKSNGFKYLNIKPSSVNYSDKWHFKSSTTKEIFNTISSAKSGKSKQTTNKNSNKNGNKTPTLNKSKNKSKASNVTQNTDPMSYVSNNTGLCDDNSGLRKLFSDYWGMIMIIAPALVILMTSVDFFKAITTSDADALKKAANTALKRTLAFVLLLFLPFIVNTIFGWFGLQLCI